MKHKHADLIHAWADGAQIQHHHGEDRWDDISTPRWLEDHNYRIKPEQSKYSDIVSDGGLDPRNNFDAQPEQEPVAWMVLTQDDKKLMLWGQEKPPIFDAPVKLIPLYTAPPRKPWVGLTDEEINDFDKKLRDNGDYCSLHFAWGVSAKLKEKNNAV